MKLPDRIELRPIADLVPYAGNAREHPPEQVHLLAASIREFGFTAPILIDSAGGIIAGHGRVMAAQLLGMPAVPCIVLDGLSDAQRRAYVIADNKLALNAGWDESMLALELSEIGAAGFDLNLTGFSDIERADLDLSLNAPESASEAPTLRWGRVRVTMTAGEKAALLERFERHLAAFGVPYGFVREGLGLGL